MARSFSQQADNPCPQCGRPLAAEIWVIVDLAERPDLAERIRQGTLHAVRRPHCGDESTADAPLLVHDPARQRLLFAYQQNTTAEQDRAIATALMTRLGETFPEPRPDYLGRATGISQQALATAIDCDALPQPPAEGDTSALPPLVAAIQAFVQADTWAASQQIVEERSELLSEEAEDLLAQFAQAAQAQGDDRARATFEEHRALLRRCREAGVPAAFAEKRGSQGPEIPEALRDDLQQAAEAESRYISSGDLAALDAACAAWQRIWEHPAYATASDALRLAALNNGGGTFLRRYWARGDVSDLNVALACWEEALQATPPGSPDRPSRLNNLGTGLSDRYARTGELADLERAIAAYEQAVAQLEARFAASPVAYKLGQQREWAGLYARLVSAMVERAALPNPGDHLRRAWAVAEGTKSRLLTEGLGRLELPAPPEAEAALVDQERALLVRLADLDTRALAAYGGSASAEKTQPVPGVAERAALLDQIEPLWDEIAACGPAGADYVALRRGLPLSWEDLSALAARLGPQVALLSLFTTGDATHLFALRAGWEGPRVVTLGRDVLLWSDVLSRLQREVRSGEWAGVLPETWDAALRRLLEPLSPHLEGVERIILAPEAGGHLVPWGVALARLGWPGSLVTLPALGLLTRLLARPARGDGGAALVVGNPQQGHPLWGLPGAEAEAIAVGTQLGAQPLIGLAATREAVLAQLDAAATVHLATHASFDADTPLLSGVLLADGVLTAREVMARRTHIDLLVLSACQTGRAGSLGGDELAGLAQAFLFAGARTLLVSLWSVNDPATATLMTAFHQARQCGDAPDVALRRAMEATAADPRWRSAHYWGAFVCMGDWR